MTAESEGRAVVAAFVIGAGVATGIGAAILVGAADMPLWLGVVLLVTAALLWLQLAVAYRRSRRTKRPIADEMIL